jgi:hypothetical protein
LVEGDDNDVKYDLLQAEMQGNLGSASLKFITCEEATKLAESI